jgi:hypothetical protein
MKLLTEAMSGLEAMLLPVVATLLLEELTFGGLVRLLMTPWMGTGKRRAPTDRSSSVGCKGMVRSKQKGEGK